jgi:hypothetical protein
VTPLHKRDQLEGDQTDEEADRRVQEKRVKATAKLDQCVHS